MGASSPPDPPPPTVGEHLLRLLESKEGADVTFQVGQSEFAARSPVFRAMFAEKSLHEAGAATVRRLVRIDDDTAPAAFASLLHFVYADALPELSKGDDGSAAAMMRASGELLGAANRYGMERMRALREAVVDAATASAALVLADRQGCARLRAFCVEYVARPEVLREVARTVGYADLKARHPAVVADILWSRWLPGSPLPRRPVLLQVKGCCGRTRMMTRRMTTPPPTSSKRTSIS